MSQVDEAWKGVGEQFQKLGAMFREHYEAHEGATEEPPSDAEMEEAVRKLTEGIKSAFGAAGDTFKDPALKEEARVTASSFFNALGATFEEIAATITAKGEKASGTTSDASGEWVSDVEPEETSEPAQAAEDEEG